MKLDLYTKIVLTASTLLLAANLYIISTRPGPGSIGANLATTSALAGDTAAPRRGAAATDAGEKSTLVKEPPVSSELQQAANRLRVSLLTECGGKTYRGMTYNEVGGDPEHGIVELKNPSVTVFAEPISEAERLNGYELKGVAVVTAIAVRLVSMSEWGDTFSDISSSDMPRRVPHAFEAFQMHKINGKWYYGRGTGVEHGIYTEVDLDETAAHRPPCEKTP